MAQWCLSVHQMPYNANRFPLSSRSVSLDFMIHLTVLSHETTTVEYIDMSDAFSAAARTGWVWVSSSYHTVECETSLANWYLYSSHVNTSSCSTDEWKLLFADSLALCFTHSPVAFCWPAVLHRSAGDISCHICECALSTHLRAWSSSSPFIFSQDTGFSTLARQLGGQVSLLRDHAYGTLPSTLWQMTTYGQFRRHLKAH